MQLRVLSAAVSRLVACGALVALAAPAAAQPVPAGVPVPAPSVSPSPAPAAGLSARAHVDVTASNGKSTFRGSAQLAMEQRGGLLRIDVLSVSAPGHPIPPIRCTLVVDHAAQTLTLWNDATHRYAVQKFDLARIMSRGAASATASPSPSPAASASPDASASPRPRRSRRSGPQGSFLRYLDVLSFTLRMTGHGTTKGVATSGLAIDLQVAPRASSTARPATPSSSARPAPRSAPRMTAHVAIALQLADDFAFFPMSLAANAGMGTMPAARVAYVVDTFSRVTPPATDFTVPAGYMQVDSPFAVIFSSMVRPSAAPSPAPSASP